MRIDAVSSVQLRPLWIVATLSLSLLGCRTDTFWDSAMYDAEYLTEPIAGDVRESICLELEQDGLKFDIFQANRVVTRVTYPTGDSADFRTDQVTIEARVITRINRRYNELPQITDDELLRLQEEAGETCLAITKAASEYLNDDVSVNLSQYDWVSGTVILYGGCQNTTSASVSFGSYGVDEQFEASVCTSDIYSLSAGQ